MVLDRNTSLHFLVEVGHVSALCELHEFTVLLLVFAYCETFLRGGFVTRIVSLLLIHNIMHRSLVSIIALNPLN